MLIQSIAKLASRNILRFADQQSVPEQAMPEPACLQNDVQLLAYVRHKPCLAAIKGRTLLKPGITQST